MMILKGTPKYRPSAETLALNNPNFIKQVGDFYEW
jgi:hypothetical protein